MVIYQAKLRQELQRGPFETDLIGIDHRQRCVRLGALIVKTIEEWMAANPPKV